MGGYARAWLLKDVLPHNPQKASICHRRNRTYVWGIADTPASPARKFGVFVQALIMKIGMLEKLTWNLDGYTPSMMKD